jgi:Macrocin-O-methyltransferase (TylF)
LDLVATRPLDPAVRLDYRPQHDITDPIETVDWTGVFWRKS